jgi:hypothetical protein
MELSGLWPGDQPFLWQLAVIAAHSRPEIDAGLRYPRNRTNDCLFFESSKFRASAHELFLCHHPLKLTRFGISEVVGTLPAKPGFVCGWHSKNMDQNRGAVVSAAFVTARRENQVL